MTLKLEIDSKQLVDQLEGFVTSLDELKSPTVLSQVARATFAITGERFMIAADNYARMNPKKCTMFMSGEELETPKRDYSS